MLHDASWNALFCPSAGAEVGIMLHHARVLSFESTPMVSEFRGYIYIYTFIIMHTIIHYHDPYGIE